MNNKGVLAFLGLFSILVTLAISPITVSGEEKFVIFLEIGPLTGPGAAAVVPVADGATDYIKDLNERGGVDGVKIKWIVVDDRYDVARGVSAYQRYRKEQKLVAAYPHATGLTKAVLPLAEQDKIPIFTSGAGIYQAKIGRVFIVVPPYQDGFGAALDWMVQDWQKKGKPGKPIVGYLGWDNPAGREPLNGGLEYAEKIGVKILPPEFYPPGSLKHDTWLTRLDGKGANYIYVEGVDPSHTNIIRDAHGLGLTQKITFVSDFWGPNATVGVRTHPNELEGTFLCTPILQGDDRFKHPMAALWTKYRKKPLEEMSSFYLTGLPRIIEMALGIALNEVGYEKVDGAAMHRALEKLAGKEMFPGLPPLDFSPTSRRAYREVIFYKITGGKLVPITEWVKTPDTVSLHKWD